METSRSSTAGSPQLHLPTTASAEEAAAIVSALEQFLADTAPPPEPELEAGVSPWKRAALDEGVDRQPQSPVST